MSKTISRNFSAVCGFPLSNLAVPASFEECLSYGQRQAWLYNKIMELDERISKLENPDESTE